MKIYIINMKNRWEGFTYEAAYLTREQAEEVATEWLVNSLNERGGFTPEDITYAMKYQTSPCGEWGFSVEEVTLGE